MTDILYTSSDLQKQIKQNLRLYGVAYFEEVSVVHGVKMYRRIDPTKMVVHR